MNGTRRGLAVGVAAVVLAGSAGWSLLAQDQPEPGREPGLPPAKSSVPVRAQSTKAGDAALSVQDALEKPFTMPFGEPTTLEEVCRHLRRTLGAPVVIDVAALDRQELRPDDTVELELNGVRLRTGLKLLLDQVGLTYRVVAEDNLLVLTDDEGAGEPLKRILAEVKELHRDIHDVQDALDEVRAALGLDEEGARMRKPTIIEQMPGDQLDDPGKPKQPAPDGVPRPRAGV
jgi:hypothetical protein